MQNQKKKVRYTQTQYHMQNKSGGLRLYHKKVTRYYNSRNLVIVDIFLINSIELSFFT